MDRRSFFSALAGIAASATLDPERLLWVPGKKIFIPPPRLARLGYMSSLSYQDVVGIWRKIESLSTLEAKRLLLSDHAQHAIRACGDFAAHRTWQDHAAFRG